MFVPADPSNWHGRVDAEDGSAGRRWHQVVRYCRPASEGLTLLGFSSDLGVRLNKGRPGAAAGPTALRQSLANLAWHHNQILYDDGDIHMEGDLGAGQQEYADRLTSLLAGGSFVLGLGGGHEIGWASYLGCRQWLDRHCPGKVLGILNFDAHFDLRRPEPHSSSGTPFYQVASHCQSLGEPFQYACLGIARASNTRALFSRANELGVEYLLDVECAPGRARHFLKAFLQKIDCLYVTCCLDVFPACRAPGVSAPAALGVEPTWVIETLGLIGEQCRNLGVTWLMADVAELAPPLDLDGRTARLAARVVDDMVTARFAEPRPFRFP